jgi:hypothetical protein
VPSEDVDRIEDLVARDEREEALVRAFRSFGFTLEELEQIRASPTWSARLAAAHTVAREVRAEEAYRVDPEHFREIAVPALRGQGHAAIMTAPELVADEVARFLSE